MEVGKWDPILHLDNVVNFISIHITHVNPAKTAWCHALPHSIELSYKSPKASPSPQDRGLPYSLIYSYMNHPTSFSITGQLINNIRIPFPQQCKSFGEWILYETFSKMLETIIYATKKIFTYNRTLAPRPYALVIRKNGLYAILFNLHMSLHRKRE